MSSSGNRSLDDSSGEVSAAELLSVLALCETAPLPVGQLIDNASEKILALENGGLIAVEQERVRILPEVAARLRAEMSGREREEACATALRLLDGAFTDDSDEPQNWALAGELLPHVLAAVAEARAIGGHDRTVAVLLTRAASLRLALGLLEPALELAHEATEAAATLGGSVEAGDAHYTLGQVLLDLDRDGEAREQLEQALQAYSESLSPGDAAVRQCRVALANALIELGQADAADEAIEEVLGSSELPVDRTTCSARSLRAWALFKRGRIKEALKEYEGAIGDLEALHGAEDFELVNLHHAHGVVLTEARDLEHARAELEEAVSLGERTLGEEHPEVNAARSSLATVLQRQGEPQAALDLLERVLANGKRVLPADHRKIWIRHRKLATTLMSMGQLERALHHVEEAEAITERTGDRDLGRLAGNFSSRAEILHNLKRFGEARAAYERARTLLADAGDANAMDLAACEIKLGRTLLVLGDLSTARRNFEMALRIYRGAEGVEIAVEWAHITRVELAKVSASMVDELAASCRALGQPDSARLLLEGGRGAFVDILRDVLADCGADCAITIADAARMSVHRTAFEALERAESIDGESDASRDPRLKYRIAAAWHRLGRSCKARGEFDEALSAFESAVPLLEGNHQFQGVALHDMAEVQEERKEPGQAISIYQEAAEQKRRADSNPRDLAVTLLALGRALSESGKTAAARAVFQECQEVLGSAPERSPLTEALLLDDLGDLESREGRSEEALLLYRRAVELTREADKPIELANSLLVLGRALFDSNDLEGALSAYEERLRILSEQSEPDPQAEGITLHDIADVHRMRGELEEAISLYGNAAELKREGGEDPGDLSITLLALARVLADNQDYAEALDALNELIDILRELPERDLAREGIILHEIGNMLRRLRRLREAISAYREAEAIKRKTGNRSDLSVTLLVLGRALKEEGEYEDALAAYRERLSILAELPTKDPHGEGVTLHDIGDVHHAQGSLEAAASLYREAAEQKRRSDSNPRDLAITLLALGKALKATGDLDDALDALDERADVLLRLSEPNFRDETVTLIEISEILRKQGRSDESDARFRKARERLQRLDAGPKDLADLLVGEAILHIGLKDGAGARQFATEAVSILREAPKQDPEQISLALMVVAEGALLENDADSALPLFAEADQLLSSVTGADRVDVAIIRRRLAAALISAGREEESRQQLRKARESLAEAFDATIGGVSMLPTLVVLSIDVEAPDLAAKVIERARELFAADPDDAGREQLLISVLHSAGRSYEMVAKDYPAALAAYREQLQILEGMSKRDGEAEGEAHHDIGDVLQLENRPTEAIVAFRQATDCFRRADEPFLAANSLRMAAEAHASAEEWDEAWHALEERLNVLRVLPEDDRRNRFEAVTLKAMAKVRLGQGLAAEAHELVRNAIGLLKQGEANETELVAELSEVAAEALDAQGESSAAARARQEADSLRKLVVG